VLSIFLFQNNKIEKMFFKRIDAYNVGLVFKNGALVNVLDAGFNFVALNEHVMEYDLTKSFLAPMDLSILLKNENLANRLIVVDVSDKELVLQFENNLFKRVLTAGRYAFWKGVVDYSFTVVDVSKVDIIDAIDTAVLMKPDVLNYVRAYVVGVNEKGLLFIDNKFVKVLSAGNYYFWKNATPISVERVDMRQMQVEIAGQEILTKDKAALRVNFNAQYVVKDMVKAVVETKDYEKQLYTILQLALREYIGAYTLDELLENKEQVAPFVMAAVVDRLNTIGVELNNCGIKDVILPGDMKDILNQVLVAEKKAQANTIMRREETASTRSLLNTAKLMEDNEMLFKLKEMEYVERIAEKINSISVTGNNQVIDQLKQIFTPTKK
jgi:regulator of protease activity HflC (stomatin/prohibitin superfamily)